MITDKKPTIQQMREIMRRMNYAYKTESSYCDWVKRFIKFSQMQSRDELFDKNKWGQINGDTNKWGQAAVPPLDWTPLQ